MRLLLLSNSTNYGSTFLGHAGETIRDFFGEDIGEVLFVPYAAVRFPFDAFAEKVAERFGPLGYGVRPIHREPDPVAAVERAEAIAVGGGNTFQLLKRLYDEALLEPIRERVRAGMPFAGWSAGSNVACPTIRTTNDMPIVEPPSFAALGLVPFQINPHYTDAVIPNHGGETRGDRLLEFVEANPGMPVVALREGSTIRVDGTGMRLLGEQPAVAFLAGREPWAIASGDFRL